MVLFDTHSLIWYTHDESKLTKRGLELIDKARQSIAYVSAISFWEIALKVKNSQIDIGMNVVEYKSRIRKLGFIEILSVTGDDYIDSVQLDFSHKDPVDRVLIIQAQNRNLKLLTKDQVIKKFYEKCVW